MQPRRRAAASLLWAASLAPRTPGTSVIWAFWTAACIIFACCRGTVLLLLLLFPVLL